MKWLLLILILKFLSTADLNYLTFWNLRHFSEFKNRSLKSSQNLKVRKHPIEIQDPLFHGLFRKRSDVYRKITILNQYVVRIFLLLKALDFTYVKRYSSYYSVTFYPEGCNVFTLTLPCWRVIGERVGRNNSPQSGLPVPCDALDE
jgi:hypothetical protein